ncbi:MAG: hypothetical protein NZ988_04320 [Thaumarchaeota archaeon]|nr:hypothetical protein [Candidatus Calditenuaceae archaeon]MDW8187253.1 hypothetical protein [Nitrososphaerota archaeon]
MVKVSRWVEYLIERYYARCGLEYRILRAIERLPEELALRIGGTPEFWLQELSDPQSRLNRLNLLDGAVEYAVRMAEHYSERHAKDVCQYLEISLDNSWIVSWLVGYAKGLYGGQY